MNEIILTERANIVAIANAVRNKTGKNNNMNLGQIVDAINSIAQAVGIDLDAELNAQDAKIASQDALIANIVSALEGKAAGSSGVTPPTYDMWNTTINYNIATEGYMHIDYLAPNADGCIVWKQLEVTGEGTVTVESLARAWVLVDCNLPNLMDQSSGLTIEQVDGIGESPYSVIYAGLGDCCANGAIQAGLAFNITFLKNASGGWF